jgi:hypothetical protein
MTEAASLPTSSARNQKRLLIISSVSLAILILGAFSFSAFKQHQQTLDLRSKLSTLETEKQGLQIRLNAQNKNEQEPISDGNIEDLENVSNENQLSSQESENPNNVIPPPQQHPDQPPPLQRPDQPPPPQPRQQQTQEPEKPNDVPQPPPNQPDIKPKETPLTQKQKDELEELRRIFSQMEGEKKLQDEIDSLKKRLNKVEEDRDNVIKEKENQNAEYERLVRRLEIYQKKEEKEQDQKDEVSPPPIVQPAQSIPPIDLKNFTFPIEPVQPPENLPAENLEKYKENVENLKILISNLENQTSIKSIADSKANLIDALCGINDKLLFPKDEKLKFVAEPKDRKLAYSSYFYEHYKGQLDNLLITCDEPKSDLIERAILYAMAFNKPRLFEGINVPDSKKDFKNWDQIDYVLSFFSQAYNEYYKSPKNNYALNRAEFLLKVLKAFNYYSHVPNVQAMFCEHLELIFLE